MEWNQNNQIFSIETSRAEHSLFEYHSNPAFSDLDIHISSNWICKNLKFLIDQSCNVLHKIKQKLISQFQDQLESKVKQYPAHDKRWWLRDNMTRLCWWLISISTFQTRKHYWPNDILQTKNINEYLWTHDKICMSSLGYLDRHN